MIDKTSIAFNLCRHKNSLPSLILSETIRTTIECVIQITESFKTVYDFLLNLFDFITDSNENDLNQSILTRNS